MTTEPVRAGSDWLTLREPADAAARDVGLVEQIRAGLRPTGALEVHDLGCGTGSMARWLAPQLPGPQRWALYDRDAELLPLAAGNAPQRAADGADVSIRTHRLDITRLDRGRLAGAALVTASALLDMLTAVELDRLVASCVAPGCPVLLTLTVTGRVDLDPPDPVDLMVGDAFDAHQRRDRGGGQLLGPDAVQAAADGFRRRGRDVVVRPSPWRLGPDQTGLVSAWFEGWWAAACEQRPDLAEVAPSYARRRLDEAAGGRLSVTVHHEDLLVLPT
ncbi:MAG TPA: class I SAM-dependent methyltransferase [Nocardioidaceae bacterium]|nr:class I SAM-dependent methyltransferase [Nocardioidaceae bacterium]